MRFVLQNLNNILENRTFKVIYNFRIKIHFDQSFQDGFFFMLKYKFN